MNGRFSRLEFEERKEPVAQQESVGTPIRTAGETLRMAVEACQCGRFEPALQLYTRALQIDRGLIAAWVGQVQMLVELGEYPEARLWSDKSLELFRNNGDLLAGKAQACLRQSDTKAAAACSDSSLACPGSSAFRWRARGEILLRNSGSRARDCFEKSLAEPLAGWFERVMIARVYVFHGQPTPALAYAQAATDIAPSIAWAWRILGDCQDAMGWSDRAHSSYQRSMQLPGEHTQTREALRALEHRSTATRLTRWLGGMFRR